MDRKILIFGGTGSLGNVLTEKYINDYDLIIASRDETKQWEMLKKFPNIKTIICDVRDYEKTFNLILAEKPNIIIIAQALKHVEVCEKDPEESIKTNIIGNLNIVNSIKSLHAMNIYKPEKICFVSTDKACNPINVYGMCKSISEKIIINMSNIFENTNTKAFIVRYGNVLSSRGSVIPSMLNSIKNGEKKLSLTDPDMTRFIMTLDNAVDLIDAALNGANNGSIWVPKLKSMKIEDLMKIFVLKYGITYNITGIRPGEKIHEVMLSLEEAIKVKYENGYFIIENNINNKSILNSEFSSKNTISFRQLNKLINQHINDNYRSIT